MVDTAAKAKEQQGKVEHHAQMFELMLQHVLFDVQPQTEYECGECLEALHEAKTSLLAVAGVSPMQLVFGRCPETPGNLLSDNPDGVANGSIIHDSGDGQSARVRTIAPNVFNMRACCRYTRRRFESTHGEGGRVSACQAAPHTDTTQHTHRAQRTHNHNTQQHSTTHHTAPHIQHHTETETDTDRQKQRETERERQRREDEREDERQDKTRQEKTADSWPPRKSWLPVTHICFLKCSPL